MLHKKTLLTLATLGLILTSGIATASAFSGDGFFNRGFRAIPDNDNRVQIDEIFTNGDYAAWAELMQNSPMAENGNFEINETTFAKLKEASEAMQLGDFATAKSIRAELGFTMEPRGGGHGFDKGNINGQNRGSVQAAIESGDYNTWAELMGDNPITETITSENFDTFVAMHQATQTKDFATAESLREELGLTEADLHMGRGPMPEMKDINGDGVCNRSDLSAETAQ